MEKGVGFLNGGTHLLEGDNLTVTSTRYPVQNCLASLSVFDEIESPHKPFPSRRKFACKYRRQSSLSRCHSYLSGVCFLRLPGTVKASTRGQAGEQEGAREPRASRSPSQAIKSVASGHQLILSKPRLVHGLSSRSPGASRSSSSSGGSSNAGSLDKSGSTCRATALRREEKERVRKGKRTHRHQEAWRTPIRRRQCPAGARQSGAEGPPWQRDGRGAHP